MLPPSPGEKNVSLFYAEKIEAARPGQYVQKFCSDCLVLCRREDNVKMDLQKWDVGVWTGLIWLRIGTGGRLL